MTKFDMWANDHVETVTARMYCACGDTLHTTGAWLTVIEKIAEFWAGHEGGDHRPCTPEISRRELQRRITTR